jgi:hypothetical protein
MTDCKPTKSVVADDAFKFDNDETCCSFFSSGHACRPQTDRLAVMNSTDDDDDDDSTMASLSRPMRPLLLHHVVSRASSLFYKGSRRCSKREALAKSANRLSTLDFRPPLSSFIHVSVSWCFAGQRFIVTAPSTNHSLFQRNHMAIIPVLSYLRAPPTRPGRLPYNHRQCN